MQPFETSATVGDHGEILLAGLPFQPGAEVAVVISPKETDDAQSSTRGDLVARLLASLDAGKNVAPIEPLNRHDLYDRDNVR